MSKNRKPSSGATERPACRILLPLRLAAWVLASVCTWLGCGGGERALSPEEALQAFQITDGFRAELFAAEPFVSDPVEMAFDENGGIYVAEMHDNPGDPPPGQAPLSRVVYLEDTDDDGRIDKQTVFADHLLVAKGVLPWNGGLIVTAAPDVLWLQDTDGDHRADVRKVLYTGFDTRANMEFRIGNPRLGVDNWVYLTNFGMPGEITSPDHPETAAVTVRGGDFRFHPLRGMAQAVPGGSQFGLALNEWGDIFITENTTHLRHAVMPPGYLSPQSVSRRRRDGSGHFRSWTACRPRVCHQQAAAMARGADPGATRAL